MPYQVLARKYRPQRFADVIGQEHVTRTLLNALAQGRIAHGYIFSGHRGIGKTTIARILASALNCRRAIGSPERPTPEPCLTCESCTEVRAGNAVDVIEIDAATNRGIDEIRELRDAARYAPARDRYKIYILDEAHQITDAAFNALLKTLEEPPAHVVFMMATTEPEDIPQTIRSRCQHYSFHAVRFDDIVTQLRTVLAAEQVGVDEETLALLAEAGDGSMRDALSVTDQAIASAEVTSGDHPRLEPAQVRELVGTVPNAVFERLLEAIGENQAAPLVEEVHRLLEAGKSASQLARQFVRYLRNVLMAKIAGEGSELLQISPDERARSARSALLFSEEELTRFLQVMLRTFDELNYRQEPRFHLELGLMKLVHLQRLLPVEQLLSSLGGANAPAPARPSTGSQRRALPGQGTGLGGAPTSGAVGQQQRTQSEPRTAPSSAREERAAVAPPQQAPEQAPEQASGQSASQPGFSPFEQDSRRKTTPPPAPGRVEQAPPVRSRASAEPEVQDAPALPTLRAEPKAEPSLPAVEPPERAAIVAPAPVAVREPEREPDAKPEAPLAKAPSASEAAAPEPAAPPQAAAGASSSAELDQARDAIVEALEGAGHSTAAALLLNGAWSEVDGTLQIAVAAKKTMLGLTFNAEADKIAREALRRITPEGARPKPIVYVPGAGTQANSTAASAPKPPRAGTVQAAALENPLVRQAQELFRAEVRSVLDLRDNKS